MKTPPMLSIVGTSGSGKTTLLEKLIPELKRRGYRIGTIKHTHHPCEVERKGKDTARHKIAGAETVILASRNRISMVKDMPCDSLEPLIPFMTDMDLVITEGYKRENKPKIEVIRAETGKAPLYDGHPDFIALVTDTEIPAAVPVFTPEDVITITDFIENCFLRAAPVQSSIGGV